MEVNGKEEILYWIWLYQKTSISKQLKNLKNQIKRMKKSKKKKIRATMKMKKK